MQLDPTNTHLQLYNNFERSIEITFYDGAKKEIPYAFLKKIPYFKKCLSSDQTKISLPEIKKEMLDLIFMLFYDARHITETFDDLSMMNPDVYSLLEHHINFLFETEAAGALETIKNELSVIPYNVALALLTNYRKKKIGESEAKPFYISTIETLLIKSIYFVSIDKYEKDSLSRFRDIQKNILLKVRNCRIIKETIKSLPANTSFFNRMVYIPLEKDEGSNIVVENLKSNLKIEQKDIAFEINIWFINNPFSAFTIDNAYPSKILQLTQIIPENSIEKTKKDLATRCWKIYEANVLCCLQYQFGTGAKMHRTELIVPELFAHYNLQPKFSDRCGRGASHTLFKHPQIVARSFFYKFNENQRNVLDLESEIVKDFEAYNAYKPDHKKFSVDNLPKGTPRVPRSMEIHKLQNEFFEVHTNEKAFSEFKQKLIKLWKWDQFKIQEFVYFKPLPEGMETKDILCFEGVIMGFDKDVIFYVKLEDFKPIIIDYRIDPTPEASYAFLQELYNSQNLNTSTKFNFFSNER